MSVDHVSAGTTLQFAFARGGESSASAVPHEVA
jgi:hypothetical protein